MRVKGLYLIAAFLPAALVAQTPVNPPYDPNDPEGLVITPNKMGRYAWKRKGTWTLFGRIGNPGGRPQGTPAATAAEIQKMTATMEALTALLRATPEGGNPVGWFMKEGREYNYYKPYDTPPGYRAAALPLIYAAGYFPFFISDSLVNGVFVPDTGGETTSMYFYFNRLPGKGSQRVITEEPRQDAAPVEFYLRPDTSVKYAGFPVVDGGELMIVRGGRDPWVAVPYGRVLKAAMVEFEKDRETAERRLADLKKKEAETLSPEYEQAMRDHLEKYSGQFRTTNPNKWKGRLEGMERELVYNREKAKKDANPQRDKDGAWYWNPIDAHADAAKRLASLTPEEAAKPACFLETADKEGRYAIRGTILTVGSDPKCREIVMDNFGYFDEKLPRTAPQILLVWSLARCFKIVDGKLIGPPLSPNQLFPPQGCHRHLPIFEALDWQKVAALLVP